MYRGEDPTADISQIFFCSISKMFLHHICLVGIFIPGFYWHKTCRARVIVHLVLKYVMNCMKLLTNFCFDNRCKWSHKCFHSKKVETPWQFIASVDWLREHKCQHKKYIYRQCSIRSRAYGSLVIPNK